MVCREGEEICKGDTEICAPEGNQNVPPGVYERVRQMWLKTTRTNKHKE